MGVVESRLCSTGECSFLQGFESAKLKSYQEQAMNPKSAAEHTAERVAAFREHCLSIAVELGLKGDSDLAYDGCPASNPELILPRMDVKIHPAALEELHEIERGVQNA